MPFSNTHRIILALLAAGAVGLSACGEPVEPLGDGSLALSWQVSPHGCNEAGVGMINVEFENAHRSFVESYPCTDGEALIEGIASANYELTLVGLDAGERETFISEARVVTIGAEKLNETSLVRLTAKPAVAEVAWRFGNGRVCGANGVSRVEVAVYDHSFYEIKRQRFSCDSGVGLVEDIIAGSYIVEAVAEGDDATWRGVSEMTLKRGDHAMVDVEMERD